jgi:xylulokinase
LTDLLLGVDIGTASVKGTVVNSQGEVLLHSSVDLPPVRVLRNTAQFDPMGWWEAFRALIARMRNGLDIATIRAVCIGGQGPSLVAVDMRGNPTYDSLIWMDRRAAEEAASVSVATKTKVDAYLLEPKMSWLKNHEPKAYDQTYKFLDAYGFISFKLTGRATAGVLRQNYTPWWSIPYWTPDHLRAVGVDIEKLPDILVVGGVIGEISSDVSHKSGLAEGTRIVQGVTDFAHDILGAGVVRSGLALDHGGTSEGFDLCWHKSLEDPLNRIISTEHIVPEKWNISGLMSTTGAVLRWFRDNFCSQEKNEATRSGLDVYEILANKASKVSAGSSGLVVLPYFAGERSPIWDPTARGLIFGLSLNHTKGHLIRAIMESVAYALRDVKEIIEERGGVIEEIRSVGGQSRSSLWNQIKSDVLNIPIVSLEHESTESLGAAMIAGYGIQVFKSLVNASDRIVRVKQRFEPNPSNRRNYDTYYALYKKLYPSVRDCFGDLADLQPESLQTKGCLH